MPLLRLLFVSLYLLPLNAWALKIFVSPEGNDAWSGNLKTVNSGHTDGPLASLNGARLALRRLPRPFTEAVEVIFASGTYRLAEAVAFTAEDSGEAGKPVTYAAAPGATVVFSGGQSLPPFEPSGNGRWTLSLPANTERFEQLWVGDRRATRARTSAPGSHFLRNVEEESPLAGAKGYATVYEQKLRLDPKELAAFGEVKKTEAQDAVITFYHKWDSTRRRVEKVDSAQGTLTIRGSALKTNTRFDHHTGVVIENLLSLLDEPGEWFLSRQGLLTYLPRPGESIDTAVATFPVVDKLITFTGTGSHKVHDLAFKNICFRHAKGVSSLAVAEPNQAAVRTVDGVITLEQATQISFVGCELSHFASYGFSLRQGSREIAIEKCLITDMGAGGIKVGTLADETLPENHVSHNRIHNNIIRDGGLSFPCAVGIWIGSSSDNVVTHNEISDLFYSAISVGWRWGYAPSNAKRNTVERNHLHHLGKGLLSDMGGVYTLGPSEGTSVSHNLIHDVTCLTYGGWGLYTDEGSTGITMEGNVTYETTDGGFHQHYGKDNIIRNNVFAFSEERQVKRSRAEEHLSFTFEKNIVVFDRGEMLGGIWTGTPQNFLLRNNLYWDYSLRPVTFPLKAQTMAAWQQSGQDLGSAIADPLFENPSARDFRLKAGSPALAMGIASIDVSTMGVLHDDPAWLKLAQTFERQTTPRPARPEAPSVNIRQNFEGRIIDSKHPFPASHPSLTAQSSAPGKPSKGLGDALTLTRAKKSEGQQSLLFQDAPGLPASYYPMLAFDPNHTSGTTTVSFDLYLEPKAIFGHEWRSKGNPYSSGPILQIRDGKLTGAKGLNLNFPFQTWVHIEIIAEVGPTAPGRWTIRITPQGQATQEVKDLPFRSKTLPALNWVGFISNANEKTEFYLDDLAITSSSVGR